jgi:hypothetical protein
MVRHRIEILNKVGSAMRRRGLIAIVLSAAMLIIGPLTVRAAELVGTWHTPDGAIVQFSDDGTYNVPSQGGGDLNLTGGTVSGGENDLWTLSDDELGADAATVRLIGGDGLSIRGPAVSAAEVVLAPYGSAKAWLGASLPVFIGLTFVLFGGAAFMTGQALGNSWSTAHKAVPYALLLSAGERFISYALFDGTLLSLSGFLIAFVILLAIELVAFQATKASKMVSQYPWLYQRVGPFSWRERSPHP